MVIIKPIEQGLPLTDDNFSAIKKNNLLLWKPNFRHPLHKTNSDLLSQMNSASNFEM
jgi:hypothetical protein